MTKSILIIALCVLQGACAGHSGAPDDAKTLLSYTDLANEITVSHVNDSRPRADSQSDDEPFDTP
jgi:hypothetical protein